ncbi:Flagellar basal-body rod modification protein FlgD [hydrothermal vent metagenome]|uniref:Flagellar basal-body rod modification protein FlgD n=1 Tax=hydrothermal vent metagenome TaxID=652676 RepID=A0A3B1BA78_9ZZZZ
MSAMNTDNDIYASLGLTRTLQPEKKGDLGQDDFLKLMVTQLKNQDPFKPMENGDFLAQIAQFSSVTGIKELNQSFADLSASMASSQAMQAGSLVGRGVLASLDYGMLPTGGSLSGEINLPASSTGVSVTIEDISGAVVRELHLGPQPAGPVQFSWDGLADDGDFAQPGAYRVKAEAIIGDQTTALEPLISAIVSSVSVGAAGEGLMLNLEGLGPLPFADVAKIQ